MSTNKAPDRKPIQHDKGVNAFGWWKASQIMWIAALITFALAGLSLIGAGIGFWLRRTSHEQHTTPPLTPPVPASVA